MRTHRTILVTPGSRQLPFAEYDTETHRWRVWLSFDPTVTDGTYLDLYDTGQCDRVTLQSGGDVREITLITGPVS